MGPIKGKGKSRSKQLMFNDCVENEVEGKYEPSAKRFKKKSFKSFSDSEDENAGTSRENRLKTEKWLDGKQRVAHKEFDDDNDFDCISISNNQQIRTSMTSMPSCFIKDLDILKDREKKMARKIIELRKSDSKSSSLEQFYSGNALKTLKQLRNRRVEWQQSGENGLKGNSITVKVNAIKFQFGQTIAEVVMLNENGEEQESDKKIVVILKNNVSKDLDLKVGNVLKMIESKSIVSETHLTLINPFSIRVIDHQFDEGQTAMNQDEYTIYDWSCQCKDNRNTGNAYVSPDQCEAMKKLSLNC